MPDDTTNAEAKLKKLGQRVRAGFAKQHPISEQSIQTVRRAVREEWQREQEVKRSQPSPKPAKTRERKPPEPER